MFGTVVTDALVVVVVLGLMIFIHELGHFMAAKFFGVRVLVFSLGFGKTLMHRKRGDTDYRISMLPFGGYVKMAGDDPTELRQGDSGEFLSQPRWRRFVIVIMGPAMNVLLAVLLLTGLYKFHFQRPAYLEQQARVGDVDDGSPAARAGVQPGDRIVRLGNLQNPTWEEAELKVLTDVGETIPVEIERGGQTFEITLTPKASGPSRVGDVGWFPYSPATVMSIEPGLPASRAGLKPGDEIVGISGHRVICGPCIAYRLQSNKGAPADLVILRAGQEIHTQVQPIYSDIGGDKRWRIGISFPSAMVVRHLPWGQALVASLEDNEQHCRATFDVLGKILSRRMSARSLSGPIGIAQLSGEAYRAGIPELLLLVSFISLQLGIFNLLPIPVLDGGVILLLLVEGALRRDLSTAVKERVAQVGVVFLLLLAVFVMYNDLVKTFKPY